MKIIYMKIYKERPSSGALLLLFRREKPEKAFFPRRLNRRIQHSVIAIIEQKLFAKKPCGRLNCTVETFGRRSKAATE